MEMGIWCLTITGLQKKTQHMYTFHESLSKYATVKNINLIFLKSD